MNHQEHKHPESIDQEEQMLTTTDDHDYGLFPIYFDLIFLDEACQEALKQIKSVTISYKDYDADYATVLEATQSALIQNGLQISSKTIYLADKDCHAVETRIKHLPSGQDFNLIRPIYAKEAEEFKQAVKFSKLFGYISILGMEVKSEIPDLMLPINSNITKAIHITPKDINLFFDCQRCLYLKAIYNLVPSYDQERHGFDNANDLALKIESDICRSFRRVHPLLSKNNICAIPFPHEIVKLWQNYAVGLQFFDEKNNFLLKGIIDDVYINRLGELIVIEYKTVHYKVDWNKSYTQKWIRQVSFYAYLLTLLGYKVHNKCYIILNKPMNINLDSDAPLNLSDSQNIELLFKPKHYTRKTQFESEVKEVSIDFTWIEPTLSKIKDCLNGKTIPPLALNRMMGQYCQTCTYYLKTKSIEDKLKQERL